MAYIGKTPQVGNYQKCDALNASATADYTLQVGSSNVSPESVNHMIVSLNGVIQSPTTAYTVSGAVLSFASALTSNDTIDFVILLGNVLDIGTPSDDTVSTAKIQDDAVTSDKLGTGDMTFPNGDLIFGTAGKGVCLGVTSNTDANTLDDYEEGSWTPTMTFGGNAVSLTYGTQSGYYTKIGRAVTISCHIFLTDKGSSTGHLNIAGLPFTPASLNYNPVSLRFQNLSFANMATAIVGNSTTTVIFYETSDAGTETSLTDGNAADDTRILFQGTYETT